MLEINNKERYFHNLDTFPIAIVLVNIKNATIVYLNSIAEQLSQYNKQEVIGKKITTLFPKTLQDKIIQMFTTQTSKIKLASEKCNSELAIARRDGKLLPIELYTIDGLVEKQQISIGIFISIEKRLEIFKQLQEKKAELQAIFDNSQVGILYLKNGRYVANCNKRLAQMLEYDSVEEIIGVSVENFHLSYEKFVWFGKHHYEALKNKEAIHIQYQIKKKSGDPIWVSLSGKAVDTNTPADLNKGVIWIVDDISDYKALEKKLRKELKKNRIEKERLNFILDNISAVSFEYDLAKNRFTYISSSITQLLGYKKNELVNFDSFKKLLHPDDAKHVTNYLSKKAPLENNFSLEFRIITKDGRAIWIYMVVTTNKHKKSKQSKIFYGFIVDITNHKLTEFELQNKNRQLKKIHKKLEEKNRQLIHQAYNDALTKLPNRILFMDRLEQAIRSIKRRDKKLAIFFIDLDHFKQINDSYGHLVGDKILIEVAKLFSKNIRTQDTLARIGGDEFLLLVEIKNENCAAKLAKKLLDILNNPIMVGEQKFYLTCSIGISIFPDDSTNREDLIKYADNAMYKVKESGRNSFEFYTKELTAQVFERIVLESNLREALKNDQFFLLYQPQYNALTNKIIGYEALIRWEHPTLGIISPAKFIPVAEENGFIIEIDTWVLQQAMKDTLKWREKGLDPGILSINLAIKHLESRNFIEKLEDMLNRFNFKGEWLKLEVLEREIMKKPDESIKKLKDIRNLGIELSIDDFGTGQSSLTYLKRFPLNQLKIDQSFVKDIGEEENNAIIEAIIALGKALHLELIAEGVETKEQLDFLISHDCYNVQGYLFSKPLRAEEFEKLLR